LIVLSRIFQGILNNVASISGRNDTIKYCCGVIIGERVLVPLLHVKNVPVELTIVEIGTGAVFVLLSLQLRDSDWSIGNFLTYLSGIIPEVGKAAENLVKC
jgi:hypothetical protein